MSNAERGFLQALIEGPEHGHECPECGNVWRHKTPVDVSQEEYQRLHTCSKCGCGSGECRIKRYASEEEMRANAGHAIFLELLESGLANLEELKKSVSF